MRYDLPRGVTLFHADCRTALASLPSNSIDAVPCDPPYELNFMGKGWDDTGIANDPALWAEVFRVLKPGGHLAAFSASRTYHRMACAIEDAGFEIRDSLMWLYGTGFPKSMNVGKAIDSHLGATRETGPIDPVRFARLKNQVAGYTSTGEQWEHGGRTVTVDPPATPEAALWDSWGTALKPAFEPIVLARKPLSEPTVAANVLRWRTGALNIDGCRIHTAGSEAREYTSKRLQPGATVIKTGENMGRQDVEFAGMTKDGRWPANVVTDGSAEVVAMFPTTNPSRIGKPRGAASGEGWGMTQTGAEYSDSGSAARFFYSAKASKADRNGSKHPTVKPIALMEWLATLITPPGGTVLDPFAGSGTTGIAAANKGFRAILCEREAEYVADIRARFGPVAPDFSALRRALANEAAARDAVAAFKARYA